MHKILLMLAALILLVEVGSLVYHMTFQPPNELDGLHELYDASLEVEQRPSTPMLAHIAQGRAECLYHKVSLIELENCLQHYVTTVVSFAYSTIASPPHMTAFIHCAADCPLVYAMCLGTRGETNHETSRSCITLEAGCLEHCLNEHWRGGSMLSFAPLWSSNED